MLNHVSKRGIRSLVVFTIFVKSTSCHSIIVKCSRQPSDKNGDLSNFTVWSNFYSIKAPKKPSVGGYQIYRSTSNTGGTEYGYRLIAATEGGGNSSQGRNNERDGVSNHRGLDCFHNSYFYRHRPKKTSKFSQCHWPLWEEFTGHRWIPITGACKITLQMFPFDDVIIYWDYYHDTLSSL